MMHRRNFLRSVIAGVLMPAIATAGLITQSGPRVFSSTGGGGGGSLFYGWDPLTSAYRSFESDITKYAAPSSLGTGSGNSRANAMSYATAFATAVAGDVVGLLIGVANGTGPGAGNIAAWEPANSGTELNPIIFVAEKSSIDLIGKTAEQTWSVADLEAVLAHADRTEFRHNGNTGGGGDGTGGPVIGMRDVHDVHISGICADETFAIPHSNTGLSIVWSAQRCSFNRCTFLAHDPGYDGTPIPTSDNHPNIRFENDTDCAARDNVLHGTFSGGGLNHCCIQRYESTGTIVEHNFTAGLFNGIFMKDQDTARNETIRFNYCTNPTYGIYVRNVNIGDDPVTGDFCRIYQNLVVGCAEPIIFQIDAYNVDFYNNTVVAPMTGFGSQQGLAAYFQGTGCVIRDNIFVGTAGSAFIDMEFRTAAASVCHHNTYFRSGTSFGARHNSNTYSSLAAWQAVNPEGSPTTQDVGSDVATPDFVNAGAGNYRAQSSTALTGSSTGGVRGMYLIGTEIAGPRYQT